MSQQALAVLVGVHAASVGQIERGIQNPRRDMVDRIDRALGAGGALLVAFGYGQASDVLSRLDAVEEVAREGVPALKALEAKLLKLTRRVVALEATVREQRRHPQASGE